MRCSGLQTGKIALHRLYYFLVTKKYPKTAAGWAKFRAEGMTIDHREGAWWLICRKVLRSMSKGKNSSLPKNKRKPGSFRPRL